MINIVRKFVSVDTEIASLGEHIREIINLPYAPLASVCADHSNRNDYPPPPISGSK